MNLKKLWKMKTLLIVLGIAVALLISSACTKAPVTVTNTTTVTAPAQTVTVTPSTNIDQLKILAGPPPASLAQYFPPKAPAPVYLIEMFTLAGPFEGIGVDMQEGDMGNLKPNFQAFKAQYTKMSNMVPEWTSRFPMDSVNALGTAVDSGNPAQIGPAMGKVGEVCSSCHLLYQVKVQAQYHWKNFDDVKIKDPLSGNSVAFTDYMTAIAGTFGGITLDIQEGQVDNARKNFQAFNAQYQAFAADSCKTCHVDPTGKEIPRKYYVDADSMALIAQMGQALSANPPDATVIGNLNSAIGNSLCVGCHLVHQPAQVAKDTWTQFNSILK